MRYIIWLLLSLLCIRCDSIVFKIENEPKIDMPINIISNYLYKYFSSREVFITMSMSSSSDVQKYFQNDMIDELEKNAQFGKFTYNILGMIDQYRLGNRSPFNLIFTDGSSALTMVLNETTLRPYHLNQQFLIVQTLGLREVQALHELFSIVMNLGLLDVNVFIEDELSKQWSLYFYKPYTKNCQSFTIYEIEHFSRDNYTHLPNVSFNELFPPKSFKFPDCPLHIAAFAEEPFVIVEKASNRSNQLTYDGIDIMIVNQTSKTMNLIPIFLQPPNNQRRGTIFKNGTVSGALGMILRGEANGTIGSCFLSLMQSIDASMMQFTNPYLQQSLVFSYTEHIDTPLSRLLAPFHEYLWISLSLLVSGSVFIILILKKLPKDFFFQRHFIIGGRMNRTPILNLLSTLIGNTIANPRMTKRKYFGTFARTLAILWIFFWLIIRNAYQGSLYDYLQSQRVNSPYDTVEKVQTSDVKIIISNPTVAFLPIGIKAERLLKHDYPLSIVLEKLMVGEWNGVAFGTDIIADYFNLMSKSQQQIESTRVRTLAPVFLFRKNSIVSQLFNQKVDICSESGLTFHWLPKFNRERKKSPKLPRKLGLMNVVAILQIYAFLCLFSIFVFVLEIFWHECYAVERLLNYLTY